MMSSHFLCLQHTRWESVYIPLRDHFVIIARQHNETNKLKMDNLFISYGAIDMLFPLFLLASYSKSLVLSNNNVQMSPAKWPEGMRIWDQQSPLSQMKIKFGGFKRAACFFTIQTIQPRGRDIENSVCELCFQTHDMMMFSETSFIVVVTWSIKILYNVITPEATCPLVNFSSPPPKDINPSRGHEGAQGDIMMMPSNTTVGGCSWSNNLIFYAEVITYWNIVAYYSKFCSTLFPL